MASKVDEGRGNGWRGRGRKGAKGVEVATGRTSSDSQIKTKQEGEKVFGAKRRGQRLDAEEGERNKQMKEGLEVSE